MKLKINRALVLSLLVVFACQTQAKSKKASQSVKEEVKKEQTNEVSPRDTTLLISGADSILISKRKVVEKWDKEWSKISYQFYNEANELAKWQVAINGKIRAFLYSTMDAPSHKGPLTTALIKRSLENFKKEAKRYDEDELNMVWNIEESYEIDATRNSFATLLNTSSMYQGGAHGSYGTGNYHFDKSTGKELHLNDFFKQEKGLLSLAEAAFRKAVGISSTIAFNETDFWFENGFFCPDNFLFTKDRVTFYYNQYEVAPYSFGTITFSMPLRQIKPYLKREL
jgi:hypothetical protein